MARANGGEYTKGEPTRSHANRRPSVTSNQSKRLTIGRRFGGATSPVPLLCIHHQLRAPQLTLALAPTLRCFLLRQSFAPLLFAPSLFRSIHSSLHNYSFLFFIFSILIYRLIAPSLFAPLLCPSVAPSFRRSIVLCSVALSLHP